MHVLACSVSLFLNVHAVVALYNVFNDICCDTTRTTSTIDDAVGEAFDKVARSLGLGFGGGPALEALGMPSRVPTNDLVFCFPVVCMCRLGFTCHAPVAHSGQLR